VELFLNLAWFSVSVWLFARWIGAVRRRGGKIEWTAIIALALLVVLLLPAISLTDDLMAMHSPAEAQRALPRHQTGLPPVHSAVLLDIAPLLALTLSGGLLLRIESAQLRPHTVSTATLVSFIRALGVRPPTTADLLIL
jgi:hypothetical protein